MTRSVKILWRVFFAGVAFAALMLILAFLGVFGKLPSLRQLENPEADLASEIISSDGLLMGKFYAENRSEVKYHEISPNVIHALIATEDERFYDHSGIDAKALARAAFTGGTQGGGSTITQQLAKMMLGQGRGNIVVRSVQKLKEWIVAVRLERNFTKEEIITLYLNHAPWGNIYGIRNASRTYFQKEPIDLKIEEAAVLIGMLKGPSIYDPIRHPVSSLNRRNTVLNQMVVAKQHYLTSEEGNRLQAKPLITNYRKIDENVGIAPYYRAVLADVLKKWCNSNRNPKTGENYDLYRDGLRIYTTIDSRMQKYAEQAVDQHMPVVQRKLDSDLKRRGDKIWKGHDDIIKSAMKFTERYKTMKEDEASDEEIMAAFRKPVKMRVFSWSGEKNEKDTVMSPWDSIKYHKQILQTAFAAMDPRTGEVKAWVGGINFKWFKYDHVTAKRQVGSTFKPLLYTLAITDAGYTPTTYIPGGPLTLGGKTINTRGGTVANCLAWSVNGAAWHLMSVIGVRRTIEFAHQAGIKVEIPPYPSIALGSAEIPMLEMLQSFTMFPNKGYNTEPILLTRIEDKNGNLLKEFPIAQSKQLISEADAYTMAKLMEGVIQSGTGQRLKSYNIPVAKAGKTGTTNGNTDGWFIGYTPELLAGAWVGCEDPFIPIYANNSGGGEMAAPAWGIFMSKVYADKKLDYGAVKEFEEPAELKHDPIYADATFESLFDKGDSLRYEDNNDGSDFFSEDLYEETEVISPSIPKPEPKKTDTSKNKAVKPEDKSKLAKPEVKPIEPPAPQPNKNDRKRRRNQDQQTTTPPVNEY